MGGITTPGASVTPIGVQDTQFFITAGLTVFTPLVSGVYRFGLLGTGGSGAAIFVAAAGCVASGGAGAGYSEKIVRLSANQAVNITLGVPGAGVVSSVSGVGVAGNAGTVSSIVDAGGVVFNLNVPGGGGGNFLTAAGTALGGIPGALPTGGDINFQGGRGGNITFAAGVIGATGGGAAGSPNGTGGRGGDSTATNTLGTATGGGAIGGFNGGDTAAVGAVLSQTASGGTGSSASGANGVTPGLNAIGRLTVNSYDTVSRAAGGFDNAFDPARAMTGGGSLTAAGGDGAGSGGVPNAVGATSADASVFGGSGGATCSAQFATSGTSICGGGSGAAASNAPGPSTTGPGGKAMAFVCRVG